MSHPINDILKETHFEKGVDLGVKRGLTGDELTAFAYNYAKKKWRRKHEVENRQRCKDST